MRDSHGALRTALATLAAFGLAGTADAEVSEVWLDDGDIAALDDTAQDALENAPTNERTTWVNPDTGASGVFTPIATYDSAAGPCREYHVTATIGGREQQVYGTACRQPDGSWMEANGPGPDADDAPVQAVVQQPARVYSSQPVPVRVSGGYYGHRGYYSGGYYGGGYGYGYGPGYWGWSPIGLALSFAFFDDDYYGHGHHYRHRYRGHGHKRFHYRGGHRGHHYRGHKGHYRGHPGRHFRGHDRGHRRGGHRRGHRGR